MTMALNPNLFVTTLELQSYFVDKNTGLPLAGGQVYFYQDINRNNLKPVYELSGSPPNYTYTILENPITLTNVGTFADTSGNDVSVYYYPYDDNGNPDNYYVAVFEAGQPPPPVGTPQITRENVPGVTASSAANEIGPLNYVNVLVNSQFVDVLFNADVGLVITFNSGTTTANIAPGWSIKILATGSGTVTVTRTSVAGSSDFATNPPYTLTITPSGGGGITSLLLIQQFTNNPGIFSGSYINVGMLLAPNTGDINVMYAPQGIPVPSLFSAAFSNSSGIWFYDNQTSITAIPTSTNAATADTGYVDLELSLPTATATTLSSVQLVYLYSNDPAVYNVPYNETPVTQQLSGLSYFYDPLLAYKPIPSYLVGWDFPYNPAQLGSLGNGPFSSGANTGNYVWDQTIIYQTASNGFTASRATNGGLFLTANANGQIALIQYLGATEAKKILADDASVYISMQGNIAGGATGNVTLWVTTDVALPTLPNTFITSLGTNGIPLTLSSSNWVQIPNNVQNTSFDVPAGAGVIPLNGWNIGSSALLNTATFFAIVVGFSPWSSSGPDTMTINSISLNAGDVPTKPAPKTQNETLADCEYYYEKSYLANVTPGTVTDVNVLTAIQGVYFPGGSVTSFNVCDFNFYYRTLKRILAPITTLYSPSAGTVSSLDAYIYQNGGAPSGVHVLTVASYWGLFAKGNKGAYYTPNANNPFGITNANGGSAVIDYHYVIDARLGVI